MQGDEQSWILDRGQLASSAAQDAFVALWEPRIGRAAARQLRRTARAALVLTPTALVFALAAAIALGGAGAATKLAGLVALGAGFLAVIAVLRSRALLADALSEWFGAEISPVALPPMRPGAFDSWCERQGLRHTATS